MLKRQARPISTRCSTRSQASCSQLASPAAAVEQQLHRSGAQLNVQIVNTAEWGLGLSWSRPPKLLKSSGPWRLANHVLAASIPATHVLSHNIPGACPGCSDPALADLLNDSEHIGKECTIAGMLVWAIGKGDDYLHGFWRNYAANTLPTLKNPLSLLTWTQQELQLLQDSALLHGALAWVKHVRSVYNTHINTSGFQQSLKSSEGISWEEWAWAVACVESRAYGVKVGGGVARSAFVPVWGEANHQPGVPTLTVLEVRDAAGQLLNIQDDVQSGCGQAATHVGLYLEISQPCTTHGTPGGTTAPDDMQCTAPGTAFYTNYGEKSNRQLIEQYGFVLPGNPHDTCDVTPSRRRITLIHPVRPSLVLVHADNTWTSQKQAPDYRPSSLPTYLSAGHQLLLRKDDVTRVLVNMTQADQDTFGAISTAATRPAVTPATRPAATVLLQRLLDRVLAADAWQDAQQRQRTQTRLAPFFSQAAWHRRLHMVAASLTTCYGAKSLSQYKSISREGQLACVHQALFCTQASLQLRRSCCISPPEALADETGVCQDDENQARHRWRAECLRRVERCLNDLAHTTHHGTREGAVWAAALYCIERDLCSLAASELCYELVVS